jgi:glucose-6-phosphate 1-dehydrogenase
MEAFLSKTYYLNGGYDNCVGMSKLNARMEQIEVYVYWRRMLSP